MVDQPQKILHSTGMPRRGYIELLNFEIEVMNSLKTKTYELTGEEKLLAINNWLGRQGLQLIRTFTNEEKEKCKTAKGPISVLS